MKAFFEARSSKRAPSLVVAMLLMFTVLSAGCGDSPSAPNPPPPPPDDGGSGAPEACFSAVPESYIITAGQTASFDASCTRGASSAATYTWELGDGRSATGITVEASYDRPGDFDVRLSVSDNGMSSTTSKNLRVNPRPVACFSAQQISGSATQPCTVRVDASCSTGSIEEYEWFFEGGPSPPISLPDFTVTTREPVYEYSWAEDEACHSFRPFERTIRLTVHDESGVSDEDETVVMFESPALRSLER